jgi:pyruvate/2-oxoglutarate/acetoin dehydrogenase E1 component
MLYGNRGLVPEQSYEVEFGKSRILRAGSDVTVIGVSHMVVEALRAADILKSEKGISAEVIDLLSISPIDWRTLCESLKKTGNLVIVDNSWTACGVSAELMAGIVERFSDLGVFRVARMGFAPAPCPTTKPLENAFYPNASSIARKCFELISPNDEEWIPTSREAKEVLDFKGPF